MQDAERKHMNTDPLTELDAVNIILENDGEAPVASLDEDGFADVGKAQRVLRMVSRAVQTDGWAFNTDFERKFTPNVDDEITLPADTLYVRPAGNSAGIRVVERGRKLYNLDTNSYTFTQPVYMDICQMLDFTDLPAAARNYVSVRAARVYQASGTGSPQQNAFTENDEFYARASLRRADLRSRPRGFFRNPREARKLVRRPL